MYNQRDYQKQSSQRNGDFPSKLDVNLILNTKSEDTERFLGKAEQFTEEVINPKNSKISTNQLRDLYELILTLKEKDCENPKRQIAKILIKLEYAYRRGNLNSNFYEELKNLLENLLRQPESTKIKNFVDFMEAVVAY